MRPAGTETSSRDIQCTWPNVSCSGTSAQVSGTIMWTAAGAATLVMRALMTNRMRNL
jgi:hypothetical protein